MEDGFDDEVEASGSFSVVSGGRTSSPWEQSPDRPVQVLVMGASTGGPTALARVIPHLPADLAVPVVVVQHMPPVFTGLLATRLDKLSPFSVSEAVSGQRLRPGHVYVAPGGYQLSIGSRGVLGPGHVLRVLDAPAENNCRPAVDVLFRSAARAFGAGTLAVVLTGMGTDGLEGARQIKARGGKVIAQDEASSVIWGMPAAVIRDGMADEVLSVDDIAPEVSRRLRGRTRIALHRVPA